MNGRDHGGGDPDVFDPEQRENLEWSREAHTFGRIIGCQPDSPA